MWRRPQDAVSAAITGADVATEPKMPPCALIIFKPTSSGMLTLHCPPQHVHALAGLLRDRGAENVVVADLGYVFSRSNPLYAKLEAGLG